MDEIEAKRERDERLLSALERTADELSKIRAVIESMIAPPQTSQEPEPCLHPEENRIDFGTTNGLPDWQCGICGARTETSLP